MNTNPVLFRVPGFQDVETAGTQGPRDPRKVSAFMLGTRGRHDEIPGGGGLKKRRLHGYCICSSIGGEWDRSGDILDQGLR